MIKPFEDNDRIAFVGDSITQHGFYICYLKEYYQKHFPNKNITFCNCGIGGGKVKTGIDFFAQDTLLVKPNIIFIMFGMNDSNRELLLNLDEESSKQIKKSFLAFKENLSKLVALAKSVASRVIIMSTPIYDEFGASGEPAIKGGYDLVKRYAYYAKEYAFKNNLDFIDIFNATKICSNENGTYNPDHTHPTMKGHYYIAKEILKEQGYFLDFEALSPLTLKWNEEYNIYRDLFVFESLFDLSRKALDEKIKCAKEYIVTDKDPWYYKPMIERYIHNRERKEILLKKLIIL